MCSAAGRGLIVVWTPAAKIRQVCSVRGEGMERRTERERERTSEGREGGREGGKNRREGGVDFFVPFK